MSNAIIHGGTRKIEVGIERKGDECIIRVADFGKGVSDEIKDRIFDEGFRYAESGKSGMGLFMKMVIEKYGGEIEVIDNEPKGAVFVLRLKAWPQSSI